LELNLQKEEGNMGKLEGIIKAEIIRLAKREVRKIAVPLTRDVRSLRGRVFQLRKTVSIVERLAASQQRALAKEKVPLEASQEEVKAARFSPRLMRSLRKHLGITQKELAILAGVTVGAVHQWETGKFKPRGEKKKVIVALRKLGRRDVAKILEERGKEKEERPPAPKGKRARKARRK
jgi:DNA-binding transcriptional regulator YiaG